MALGGLGNVIARLAVTLSVDNTDLNRGLADSQAQLKATTAAINGQGSSMKDLSRSADVLTSSTKGVTDATDRLKSSGDRVKTTLDNNRGSATALASAHNALKQEIDGVFNSGERMKTSLDRLKSVIDGNSTASKNYRSALRDMGVAAKDADSMLGKLAVTLGKAALRNVLGASGLGKAGATNQANSLIGSATQDSISTFGKVGNVLSSVGSSIFGVLGQLPLLGGAFDSAGSAASGLGAVALPVALGALAALVVSIGSAVGILGTFSALLVAATVIVGGFTVGLAGLVAIVGLALGGIGFIGAGMAYLAVQTGQVDKPLKTLEDNWKKTADTLGKAAVPAVKELFAWLGELSVAVTPVGKAIIDAFSGQLPGALNVIGQLVQVILNSVTALTPVFARFIGQVVGMAPAFMPLFQTLGQLGVQAVQGLLNNLLRLSNWFLSILPSAGPIVGQIFSQLGSLVQQFGAWGAQAVNFSIQHWPQITSTVNDLMNAFHQLKGPMDVIWSEFQDLWTQLSKNKNTIEGLELSAKIFGGAFISVMTLVMGIVLGVVGTLTLMGETFNTVKTNGTEAAGWIKGAFYDMADGLKGVWNTLQTDATNGVNGVINVINGFVNDVNGLGIPGLHINAIGYVGGGTGTGGNVGGHLAFANGGVVPGGYGGGDRVPAMLTPGEGVLNLGAMRGLGAGFVNAVNGLGAGSLGSLGNLVGSIGGQCLAWVSSVTGLFRGVPAAIDLAPDINSSTPSAGEIFVMTLPPYGHTGFVLGPAVGGMVPVIDSNWNLDEVIRAHTIPTSSIAGYINEGLGVGNLTGALAGLIDPGAAIGGLVQKALGNISGLPWPGGALASYVLNTMGSQLPKLVGADVAATASQAAKAATGKGSGRPAVHSGFGAGVGLGAGNNGTLIDEIRGLRADLRTANMEIHWHSESGNGNPSELVSALSWGKYSNQI